ncbi:MAG: hypothetical protein AB7T63_09820 [Planctomycetota bacterium]
MTSNAPWSLHSTGRVLRLVGWAALLAVAMGAGRTVEGRGGEMARAPDFANGGRFFDQAVQFVSGGQPVVHQVRNFYADLADTQVQIEGNQQEGFLRLWFDQDDRYRFEIRPERALAQTTTKILNGDRMWVISPDAQVSSVTGTADGARAIQQLKQDRARLADLAAFLTLQSLKGDNVRFDYEGVTQGGGAFAGDWLKVNRVVGQEAQIVFFFAYEKDGSGRPVKATWPGVVTVVGDAKAKEPTEYYLLRDWKAGPYFRYPARIEAFSQEVPGAPLKRFLMAFPQDIRINANIPPALFEAPQAAPPPSDGNR